MATLTGFLKDNTGVYIEKDTEAILTYTLDYTDFLPTSTTISSSSFTLQSIAGDGDPLVKVTESSTSTASTVKISGGTAGKIYKVFNTITTSGSLTERRFFRIKVIERSL